MTNQSRSQSMPNKTKAPIVQALSLTIRPSVECLHQQAHTIYIDIQKTSKGQSNPHLKTKMVLPLLKHTLYIFHFLGFTNLGCKTQVQHVSWGFVLYFHGSHCVFTNASAVTKFVTSPIWNLLVNLGRWWWGWNSPARRLSNMLFCVTAPPLACKRKQNREPMIDTEI